MANYLLTQTGEEVQDILNQAPETEAGLQQEVTNREQAITAEQQAREQAIAAEATAREQAIAAEATARVQAIAAEATARADADDALDAKIDAETTRAEGAEGTLDDKIDQEVSDRTAAVTAEATARQQADTALQQALAQETSRAQQAELANAQAISTEAQALQAEANTRQNADTVLQDHIDDEEERAKAAETTLQSNIDAIGQTGGAAVAAERERAEAAESTLDGKIDAETDRAEDAEQTLTDAIAKEVTDRTAAVSAEATARQQADTAEATARADADAALQTAINGKQATIADLAAIRSGAAAGATAYQKPATGIPATDMSAGVQTSLDKADSALQEHQSLADYYTKSEVDSLITTPDQEYVSVTATAQTTAVTDLLPATGAADTIYRVGNWDGTQYDPTMYALFAWNGTTYVCLAVRSFVGEVYDISVNHPDGQGNPTPYADLTAALGTDGANIPADFRRGGMSIKFIQGNAQSSDNKYVQYRLLAQNFTTDVTQWQGVDKELIPGSINLVENGVVTSEVGKHYSYSVEGSTHTKICDLALKSGSKLLICVNGTSEATRLIIRANSNTGTILADYVVVGRKYEITLPEDITSVWLWADGSYDLDFDLYFGISMTLKNIIDNANLSETGLYSVAVETGEGTTIKEIIQSVDIKQGDVFYVIADGTINGRLIIRGNRYDGESGTILIKDNVVSGACYRIVATADIYSIGIRSNAPVNCSIYFYTNALKETMELCSRVPSIEDNISALYRNINQIQVTKSGSTNVKITDLKLPSGSHIYIKVSGSSSATRLIIRENSASGNTLQDYVLPGRVYDVITASDITSLWLWANGEYDLKFNISTGIEREVTINSDSILNSQSGIFVSSFVKEGNTTVNKELIQDINVKTGETIYVSTVGIINDRLIIRANKYDGSSGSVLIKDYVEPGVIYKFVAPEDLEGVGVWCNGSANIRLYVYTKASVDIFRYSELYTNNLIGFEYKQEFSGELDGASHKTAKVFENLTIKKNQKFSIFINGNYNGRVIIRANSGSENTLIDYAEPYTWYDFTASMDITSIYVLYAVDLDVEFVITRGIDSELSKYKTNLLIPHTVLGSGITKSLAYKQLGALSKAYICISDDDGHEGLGSYTLPMIIQKGIPFTACIFSTCASILNNTYKNLILDAYNNHGLCIAQHDNAYWDVMSERQLYDFIEKEKAAFAEMGITVKGAAIPGHRTNYLVESVFGESYNVVRCGYNGNNTDDTPAYHTIYYKDGNLNKYALSVPRSNIYCLSSSNIKDYSLDGWKDIIDFAIANKMFVSIHMHDNDFVETADNYLSNRALLEGVIDYAKTKDITFVTLGDIDRLY